MHSGGRFFFLYTYYFDLNNINGTKTSEYIWLFSIKNCTLNAKYDNNTKFTLIDQWKMFTDGADSLAFKCQGTTNL